MPSTESSKKRKAVTKDSPLADEVALSDGEADDILQKMSNGLEEANGEDGGEQENFEGIEDAFEELDSEIDSDEEVDITEDEADESEDELDSDEVPSEDEDDEKMKNGGREMSPEEEVSGAGKTMKYRLETGADGQPRYVYDPVDTAYDSDDSDAPATTNTIGNIPMHYYDAYPHVGYDINGRKISRPAKGEALDALLDSIDIPKGWTGLTDPATGKPLHLTDEELEVLKRVTRHEVPEDSFDMYPDMIEYFSGRVEQMPLSSAPEPKRRFVPSKHEARRVMKIVKAIKEGRIQPYKSENEADEAENDYKDNLKRYDIWADEKPRQGPQTHIPAPKLPPPGYEESYHPPPEYLPDAKERQEFDEQDEEDRQRDFLPQDHDALRKVAGYGQFIKEKFERCLDLYLAPRIRRSKLNIDPESLLPKLPDPEELRPYPSVCATLFRGTTGKVRSLNLDPTGKWLCSGGDDGILRVHEVLSGRNVWQVRLSREDAINMVRWRPGIETAVIAAAVSDDVFLIVPQILNPEMEKKSIEVIDAGFGHAAKNSDGSSKAVQRRVVAPWTRPGTKLESHGALLKLTLRKAAKSIHWHRRGDYFATVSPAGQSSAVAIHTLSKHLTQLPFRSLKGLPQTAQFHPLKPIFFVATQRTIRSYDLSKQTLLKILQPGARWISSIDVHPGGDNLIAGSYDKRLLWHDLELSSSPYKTLRYHEKAIRAVRFHPGTFPLLADASDDGTLQIFHGKVVDDAMENATIVPLKVLRGHAVTRGLGVMDLDWCPGQAWCMSAGADGTCRLWM